MSIQTDPIEENMLRRIPFEIIILAAIFGLLAVFLFDLLTGLFVLVGGALASLSFLWLKKSLTRVLLRETGKAVRSGVLLYAVRLILIIGIFLIIIFAYPKKLLAFAAGFSTVIPVFLGETVVALARLRQWKS
jgi:small-conductance mechanosensitive channel